MPGQLLHPVRQRRRPYWRALEQLEARTLLAATIVPVVKAGAAVPAAATTAPRIMENLGRGVAVVHASTSQALVSWRLLALDPAGIAFNVYRSANGGAFTRLNGSPLTAGTDYLDTTANFTISNVYHVRPVINGVEQAPSGAFTLKANTAVEPVIRVPLRTPLPGYYTKFVWVGDLNGDGEYEFVIDRLAPGDLNDSHLGTGNQFLEAYQRDGTFLWSVDMGPTSTNIYNIEPGAATIDMGHYDGVTVADMDCDGKAEVLTRAANGTVFGNGEVLAAGTNIQFVCVLDGMTGACRARLQWSTDYLSDGPMGWQVGIGYLDGVHPSFVINAKNRIGSGAFNETVAAYRFDGTNLTRQWKWNRGNQNCPDGHQIRIADVDGDGKDEVIPMGFVLDHNGTLLYSLAITGGVVHGDRFDIGVFDPSRPGLQGYAIQQGNPSGLYDCYYDASNGQMIWQHFSATPVDVGRGMAADIDPNHPGYEVWAFNGLWNAATNTQIATTTPYPQFGCWWDGDLLGDNLNDGKLDGAVGGREVTMYKFDGGGNGSLPLFVGDIWGDWREEIVMINGAQNSLTIFSTDKFTNYRIYTLAQDPYYRNCMTTKGYYQTNYVDYYLGAGMATPPVPNIVYAGTQPVTQTLGYQAEAALLAGGVTIDTNHLGYNGTGFANLPTTGGSVRWNNVDGGAGGFTTIRLRYSLGTTTTRTGRLTVNGAAQNVTCENTGTWDDWLYLSVSVPLTAGRTNTILLESTGQDFGNVDELQVDAIVPAAPALRSLMVNDGSAQRSMVKSITVTFDQAVNLGSGALALTRGGSAVTLVQTNPSGDGRVWVLTFTGAGIVGGSLADGLYDLQLTPGAITSNFGQTLTGGVVHFGVHRLYGDFDGDRDVDALDLAKMSPALNTASKFNALFDYNGDGRVDGMDLLEFKKRLNKAFVP